MAALLVEGIVGLFSEIAINIAFTELSHIFHFHCRCHCYPMDSVKILGQLVHLSYLFLEYF